MTPEPTTGPAWKNAPPAAAVVHALLLDGHGGGRSLAADLAAWRPADGPLWLHLDCTVPGLQEWLMNEADVDALATDALLAPETRPRVAPMASGLFVCLRGVNLNPDSDPEDMVAVRLVLRKDLVITCRRRTVLSIADIAQALAQGAGPCTTQEFLVTLADRLTVRMSHVVEATEDRADELEGQLVQHDSQALHRDLLELRRELIALRRHLAPQREALGQLVTSGFVEFAGPSAMRLREATDHLLRYLDALDTTRERASLIQEELVSRRSEELNSRMYVLSVVAALFMPLGFLTGLLGINIGGIPGAGNPHAFVLFLLMLAGVVGLQFWILRRRRWL